MTASEKFLAAYREYELLLRDAKGLDVKNMEDMLPGTEGARMRMCRLFRNYLSHTEDPGFIEPTPRMQKWIEGMAISLRMEGDTAKKHLKKPEACLVQEADKLSDVLAKFSKLKCQMLYVQKKDGTYASLCLYDCLAFKPAAKVSLVRMKAVKPVWCMPSDSFSSFAPGIFVLCTSDGTPSGKLLGQVWTYLE